ncbi:MAG: MOSC domain-containing protein [Gemmatimonadales bacterium]
MRLHSIQIGTPRTVGTPDAPDRMQREFTSAIWKEPVAGPVWVGNLGLRGDQVADTRAHGGPDQAVLMYAITHYLAWRAEWGREDVGPGAFGENLTVEGLTEEKACLGDVYLIGGARLEVTKPREPCATLARRHQVPDMIAIVQANGRSGWYLRVLEEGEIEAGQAIALAGRPHPEWPVREVALAMRERKSDPERASRLARVPALAANWRLRILGY